MTQVLLDKRAEQLIGHEALKRRLLETGGAIFGWHDQPSDQLVIACASGPGPRATHRPTRFAPNPTTTAKAMHLVTTSSLGRYGFIGTWHTHPGGGASPSHLDSRAAEELAEQDDLLLPQPLLLIVSTRIAKQPRVREIKAWRWDPSASKLIEAPMKRVHMDTDLWPADDLFCSALPARA